jgi:hypothetical protein
MNAYRAYDVIEERKWAEQTLTEESKSGLTIGQKKSSTPCRKSRQACASLIDSSPMKDFAAIKLARPTTISFLQLLTPRRNTTGNTVPAARFKDA